MRKFIITGLPRSRTAWMSVAATTEVVHCEHEPYSWYKDLSSLASYWAEGPYEAKGVSDSVLGFDLAKLLEDPELRVLVLWRNVDEVQESLAKLIGKKLALVYSLANTLALYKGHPRVDFLAFEDMDDTRMICRALFRLTGVLYNAPRIDELQRMNIQTDMIKYLPMGAMYA